MFNFIRSTLTIIRHHFQHKSTIISYEPSLSPSFCNKPISMIIVSVLYYLWSKTCFTWRCLVENWKISNLIKAEDVTFNFKPCLLTKVYNQNQNLSAKIQIQLRTGSNRSFISLSLAKELKCEMQQLEQPIQLPTGQILDRSVHIQLISEFETMPIPINVQLLVHPEPNFGTKTIVSSVLSEFIQKQFGIKLAHAVLPQISKRIHIIIGTDLIPKLSYNTEQTISILNDNLRLFRTRLGWTLQGNRQTSTIVGTNFHLNNFNISSWHIILADLYLTILAFAILWLIDSLPIHSNL